MTLKKILQKLFSIPIILIIISIFTGLFFFLIVIASSDECDTTDESILETEPCYSRGPYLSKIN